MLTPPEAVKPIELMRWLVRLTKTPTGGHVLDPFMGSATTGIAAMIEGREFTGIEREREYFTIAEYRMKHWQDETSVTPRKIIDRNSDYSDLALFADN